MVGVGTRMGEGSGSGVTYHPVLCVSMGRVISIFCSSDRDGEYMI